MEVLDRDEFIGDLAVQITSFVTVIYGLLVLSIIIALIGIANTLSLSINERTPRARPAPSGGHEPAPDALDHPLGGGAHLAARRARRASRWGSCSAGRWCSSLAGFGLNSFALPVGPLVVIVVLAAALGTLAAERPARRAAKLDILDAIATE